MNNKGFTILELLASIIILAIIMTIAIPSINSVNTSVRNAHYKNMVKNIEIAASKYAFDTGDVAVYVDTLIKEGYLKSDNDTDNLIDPRNNTSLNCNLIEMTKVNNYYEAHFLEESYDNGDGCNIDKLNEKKALVYINVINNGEIVNDNSKWLKGDVTLKAMSKNFEIDCLNKNCIWSSTTGLEGDSENLEVIANNIVVNATYNFQVTIENDSNNLQRYMAKINLKIDNEEPSIKKEETTISDELIETTSKIVEIKASDGIGSGIDGYFLGKEDSCYNDIIYRAQNNFTVNENGTYLICVKDKVGNIASDNIEITNIISDNID